MTEPPRLRLAYLVSQYPAISHTFILREVRYLRAEGFDIHLASINNPDRAAAQLTQEEREEAQVTYYVKPAGLSGALKAHLSTLLARPLAYLHGLLFALRLGGFDLQGMVYGFFYFVEAVMIGQWMQEKELSHLHVHFATPASTVGLIGSKIFPFTFSLTVHGPDEFYEVTRYRLSEKITGASFLCCIGTYARSQLMKLSEVAEWEKFELTPLGVDLAVFTPQPFRPHPAPFTILCVGRLVPAKGQHILLAAVERLVKAGRQVRLCLVGDGPDRARLEEKVRVQGLEPYVTFAGAVNQDRIRALYAEADVFALASFAEGIPVVLMEAMAMSIPCVTTYITGIPELIRDGIDGLLVPPADAAALADAIVRLMDDPALRQRLGEAGRRRVQDKYDLNRNTAALAALFRQRLQDGRLRSHPENSTSQDRSTHYQTGRHIGRAA
ncbi:MAG: glycosyltransferase family 4 protein [Deltaproteobacteria bacterium]|nr:glycosyltransferase family 4 protein [Deltaproteobacteria bacterium]